MTRNYSASALALFGATCLLPLGRGYTPIQAPPETRPPLKPEGAPRRGGGISGMNIKRRPRRF